jgi:hypothetical protein
VFNIQKAVGRLNFAPKLNEIEITDIKNGIGVFTPKAEKPVSFAALKDTLKKAGYTLASAKIIVSGKLVRDTASGWLIVADTSGQRFALAMCWHRTSSAWCYAGHASRSHRRLENGQ